MKTIIKLIFIISFCICGFASYSQTLNNLKFLPEQLVNHSDSMIVNIDAQGSIKGLVSNQTSNQETTGSLSISIISDKVIYYALVNVASTIDTIKSNYSSSILNPTSGKALTSGLFDIQIKKLFWNWGLHIYASGSSSNWAFHDTIKSASVVGVGALFSQPIIPWDWNSGPNMVQCLVEVGPTFRLISGNVISNRAFYQKMLGTDQNVFGGLEGGLKIVFNQITAGIQAYWLFGKNVEGITSIQLTGGISISGSIFKTTVRKPKKLE